MSYIAIHRRGGTYSDRWVSYCQEHGVPYRTVDCLASNIIEELRSATGLLWNWSHLDPGEQLVARHIIMAVEAIGLYVFPSTSTCWHFDDKIAQKYLLESLGAPVVPTHVFYNLQDAVSWIDTASFPKVFKLRRGAGSANVKLVNSAMSARSLAKRAFGRGFQPVPNYMWDASRRYRVARLRHDLFGAIQRMPRVLSDIRRINHGLGREKGYVYFQDFMPGNTYDIRVTVIGNRAFAFTRNVRAGDFRASGSGDIIYDIGRIDLRCVRMALELSRRAGSQSMAFDFVLGNDHPSIVEVSYCYDTIAVYNCEGHWDDELNWHEGHMWPQDAILIDLLKTISLRNRQSCTPFHMSAAITHHCG
jgi:glutathione synthase/RimK-type ligase-like ATP-grasp enzyme